MKKLVLAVGVVLASGSALAQQSGQQTTQQLYQSKCAACHGKDGKGTTVGKKMGATDLATAGASQSQLENVITNGKNKMPAYKGRLTQQQIDDLATFIKNGMK